ncbi:ubiquitin-conjugating enzyme/RWD-like protein [Cercophora scortea]|uniref:Ubiquitin-conjugating enzyme/RWD-like protein n=1 Tax=Cercophora scortea TaxID=314031 RepID=A0AAE0IM84_9PEZI|nr:ubiquitin-conjugating enzyme/RWD-like protein [Cercophora scortea]
MATPKFNSKSPTIRRILREAHEISSSPSPDYTASPLETDLFEWHFTFRGPPNSAYASGIYHGRIVLPPSYPLAPPMFRFLTASGRFETNRDICLSISGHHAETWQPAWGVRTALVALRSFMETDVKGQLGGLETSEAVRRRLADESVGWRCGACGKGNADIMRECEAAAREHAEAAGDGEKQAEVEVPAELKMGWKDEMDKAKEEAGGVDGESAELAEGFVQTAAQVDGDRSSAPAGMPARPGQGVPEPTRTVPLPGFDQQQDQHQQDLQQQLQQQLQRQLQQQQQMPPPLVRRVSDDEVSVWIDRLIVLLGVLLAALVLKVLST